MEAPPLTGFWFLCRPKVPYYGAYPSGFLLRARRALAVPLSVPLLHVCGGRARDYSKPEYGITKGVAQRGFGQYDRTLDLDPGCGPDYTADARAKWPELPVQYRGGGGCAGWPGALIDRPYTPEDADHYGPGREALPELGMLLTRAVEAVAIGGRVGVLDYLCPRPPLRLEFVAAYAVLVGFGNRVRVFSVFERVEARAGGGLR